MIIKNVVAFVLADKTKEYTSKKDGEKKQWREISIVGSDDTNAIPVHVPADKEEFKIEVRKEYLFTLSVSFEWNKLNIAVLEHSPVE